MSKIEDLKYHGGQSWLNCANFVEDFSVTTNALGTPVSGKQAMMEAMSHINHYPPSSQEPALSDVVKFLWPKASTTAQSENNATAAADYDFESLKKRVLLGNGSSELIDLTIRYIKGRGCTSFRPGPTMVQYKDYERCALSNGLTIKDKDDEEAKLLCMVNPTNPTGDFRRLSEVKRYITDHCPTNSYVIVDESMLFWYGSEWRTQSLTSQLEWIDHMKLTRGITIFIIESWTKIWSCCGIRIGSVVCPSEAIGDNLRTLQTPWSVNALALAFMSASLKDEEYFRSTWEFTKIWRRSFVEKLEGLFPAWRIYGADFTSWVWVDTGSIAVAKCVSEVCEVYGVPIRWAKHGYKLPSCIRFGVRKPEFHERMFDALTMTKRILSGDDTEANEWRDTWVRRA